MPNLPLPSQTDVTIQNQATGAIDFLKYEGSSLVASRSFDYGIGSDWKVVASEFVGARPGLVVQSASTGRVDLLGLDANGNLVSSAMSSVAVPRIAGFVSTYAALVSQLPDGELDFLRFNSTTGAMTNSDLIPNTAGMPHAVAGAEFHTTTPVFVGLTGSEGEVVTQLADGSVDLLGLTSNFGTIAVSTSLLLAGSTGFPMIAAVNQNDGINYNVFDSADNTEGLQLVGQTGGGQPDVMYYDTGVNNTANAGVLYASNLLNTAFPGWNVVDGGYVNHTDIFPIS